MKYNLKTNPANLIHKFHGLFTETYTQDATYICFGAQLYYLTTHGNKALHSYCLLKQAYKQLFS